MNKGILLSIFNNKQIFEKPVVFATNLLFSLMLNHLTLQPEFQTSSEIQVTYLRFCYPDPLVHGKRSAHAHAFTTPTSANAFDSERA